MGDRDVWVRWDGEYITECALRPSNEGAWSQYVQAGDSIVAAAQFQAICDLASARLSSMESGGFAVDENLRHDLKEIVRLTGGVATRRPATR